MPTYCFRDVKTGKTFEKFISLKEYEDAHEDGCIFIDGKEVLVDTVAQHRNTKAVCAGWPRLSEALAVDPSQISEEKTFLKNRGVNADFAPDGRAIVESARHQKNWCKAVGFVDRRAYC